MVFSIDGHLQKCLGLGDAEVFKTRSPELVGGWVSPTPWMLISILPLHHPGLSVVGDG